jgi:hypothetical protein
MTRAHERVDEVSASGVAEVGRREVPGVTARSAGRVVHIHVPVPEGVVEECLKIPEETPGGGQSRGRTGRRGWRRDSSGKQCHDTSHAFHNSNLTRTEWSFPPRGALCHCRSISDLYRAWGLCHALRESEVGCPRSRSRSERRSSRTRSRSPLETGLFFHPATSSLSASTPASHRKEAKR